jgi:pimeloyl-ACP methyl ester carboxylesterase
MKQLMYCLAFLLVPTGLMAHGFDEREDTLQVKNLKLFGTLSTPAHAHQAVPLVVIIAGSGPTDREGNQPGLHPDTYKKMAHALALQGIACFRYDKRGAGKSASPMMQEADLRFTDFVQDVRDIIAHYQQDARFSKIVVAGHSEGSLIGMMAVGAKNDFISLCGAGEPATRILKTQLRQQLGDKEASTFRKIDSLAKGMKVTCDYPSLWSLFRPSVQPYLISWFSIDPAQEIKKVAGRILLIGGGNDLQVAPAQLRVLELAANKAQTKLFNDMNHVLVDIYSKEAQDNYAAYNKPELPISLELISTLVTFIRSDK